MRRVELLQRTDPDQHTVASRAADRRAWLKKTFGLESKHQLRRRTRSGELHVLLEQRDDVAGTRIIGADDRSAHGGSQVRRSQCGRYTVER